MQSREIAGSISQLTTPNHETDAERRKLDEVEEGPLESCEIESPSMPRQLFSKLRSVFKSFWCLVSTDGYVPLPSHENDDTDFELSEAAQALANMPSFQIFAKNSFFVELELKSAELEEVKKYQVTMLVGIVCHLLQQPHIEPKNLVILTPYIGQLEQICQVFASKEIVLMGQSDMGETAKPKSSGETCSSRNAIRASTIRDYKYENIDEETIFVISLMTYSTVPDPGILSDPRLINKLLARPSAIKYLIGNFGEICERSSDIAKEVWDKIRSSMQHAGRIFPFYPVLCQEHNIISKISSPAQWDKLARRFNPLTNESTCACLGSDACQLNRFDSSKFRDGKILKGNPAFKLLKPETGLNEEILHESHFCEKDVRYFLEIYKDKGALQADDAVEKCLVGFKDHSLHVLSAFQFIIRSELGFKAEFSTHDICLPVSRDLMLCDAIFCQAILVRTLNKYPMSVLQCAHRLVVYSKSHPLDLPQDWVQMATQIVRTKQSIELPKAVGSPSNNNSAKSRWKGVQRSGNAPKVMEEILSMIGIEEVKSTFVSQYYRLMLAKDQLDHASFRSISYNARLEGNPGTGKSRIAKHYTTFLKEMNVLPRNALFFKTTGATLTYEGVGYFKKNIAAMNSVGGGVFFIQDAYRMVSSIEGNRVLDFILSNAEGIVSKPSTKVVWLLEGHPKDMEKLLGYSGSLPSRFPLKFEFKDLVLEDLILTFRECLCLERDLGQNIEKKSIKITPASPTYTQLAVSEKHKKGDEETDVFGFSWTFDGTIWFSEHGALCTLSPKYLGMDSNPLIAEGCTWTYNERTKIWSSNGKTQSHYPGIQTQTIRPLKPRGKSFRCEDEKFVRVAMRRLCKMRGQQGFENARAVRLFFEQVRWRQAQRLAAEPMQPGSKADIFLFKREDIIGPPVTSKNLMASKAYKELQSMEGLAEVKCAVDCLIKLAVENARRELEEKPTLDIVINRVFLGNPGTGKSTVAKLYAQLLTEMGLLSKGDVIFKVPSDFVGNFQGTSEKLTRDILAAARGCVLVIDEAYSLYSGDSMGGTNGSNSYNAAIINTIVEQIPAKPGDDRAVLLLGYKDEMHRMLKNSNPGLMRRFQLEHAFEFSDYDDEALLRILLSKVHDDNLEIDFKVAKRAVASLAKQRAIPNFGNAGAVENMLSEAKLRMPAGEERLTLADFGLEDDAADHTQIDLLLENLVGCQSVKSMLQALSDTVMFSLGRGDDPKEHVSYNYLFLGNPGTGKTTVARRMGQIFKALGLLPDDIVHDVSASDFLTGFTGQTGKKTREILQRSKGGVLFIDEAYQMNPSRGGQYMTEAVDELVKCLTSPEFHRKVLVILAGYEMEMEQMLSTNTGLNSRFTERVQFENLGAKEAAMLMMSKMLSRKLPVADNDQDGLVALAERLVASDGFSNGRDIDNWSAVTYQKVSISARSDTNAMKAQRRCVTLQEMEAALNKIISGRSFRADLSKKAASLGSTSEGNVGLTATDQVQSSESMTMRKTLALNAPDFASLPEKDGDDQTLLLESVPECTSDSADTFQALDKRMLLILQDALQDLGLTKMEDISRLSCLQSSDPEIQELVTTLVSRGIACDKAQNEVLQWQKGHKQLKKESEDMVKSAGAGMQAIWRCLACGRGGKPWQLCTVAPYIESFEPIYNGG